MYSEEEYKRPDSSESYLLDQWVRIRVHNWYMQGGGGGARIFMHFIEVIFNGTSSFRGKIFYAVNFYSTTKIK